MSSSGGGDDSGAGLMALMGQGRPMPGLPVAGSEGAVSDPFDYGKYQSFLPEIKAEGVNDMATGLRPEMFDYKKPSELRNALAAVASGAAAPAAGAAAPAAGAAAVPQTMGLGASSGTMYGMGSPANGVGPPPGAQQLPTPPGGWAPGNVPGWPGGGPGTPIVRPGVNAGPEAAAAALAAAKASGG